MPTPPRPSQTETPAATANGNSSTAPPKVIAGTNLPAPAPDSRVDVKAKLRDGSVLDYEADAKDVATEVVKNTPRVSPEQAAIIAQQSQRARGRRYTELDEWLEYWREFGDTFGDDDEAMDVTRFQMSVTREADIILPGTPNPYARPCPANEFLGQRSFVTDVNLFIGMLQAMNGNSGGRVRVVLKDGTGDSIKGTWFDNRGNPIEGQQNGVWAGAIPNPIGVQTTEKKEGENKGPKTAKQFLRELKEEIEDLKAIGLVPDKQENNNNLLDSVNVAAATTIVTKLSETISAISAEANKRTSNDSDKGFFRSLAEGDEGQKRIWSAFDTATGLFGGIAADYMRERAEAQREKRELKRLEFLAQHPELANNSAAQNQVAAPAEKETIYDYICRKCEEADTLFDFATDAVIAEYGKTNAGEMALVRGTLAQDLPAEEVLNKFVAVCKFKGKGERAERLRTLPQTIQFIEKMQRSVKGA